MNETMKLTKRWQIGFAALLGALGMSAAVLMTSAGADNGSPQTGHIGICHHTGNSQAHEWVYIEPDASGVWDGHAKGGHQDFYGPEDIIPAFQFIDAHGDTHTFAGQNLDTQYDSSLEPVVGSADTVSGAVILANKCVFPTSTPPPSTSTETVTVPGQTTTVHDTTTITLPGQTVTQTVTGPTQTVTTPGQTQTITQTVTNTQTVTTPGQTTTVTKTVASPPKTITRTKTKVVTKVKWRTKFKVVKKYQCVRKPKTLAPTK